MRCVSYSKVLREGLSGERLAFALCQPWGSPNKTYSQAGSHLLWASQIGGAQLRRGHLCGTTRRLQQRQHFACEAMKSVCTVVRREFANSSSRLNCVSCADGMSWRSGLLFPTTAMACLASLLKAADCSVSSKREKISDICYPLCHERRHTHSPVPQIIVADVVVLIDEDFLSFLNSRLSLLFLLSMVSAFSFQHVVFDVVHVVVVQLLLSLWLFLSTLSF